MAERTLSEAEPGGGRIAGPENLNVEDGVVVSREQLYCVPLFWRRFYRAVRDGDVYVYVFPDNVDVVLCRAGSGWARTSRARYYLVWRDGRVRLLRSVPVKRLPSRIRPGESKWSEQVYDGRRTVIARAYWARKGDYWSLVCEWMDDNVRVLVS